MDAETAKKLFEHGSIIIIHDFPEQSEFGIDCHSWNTGPKFRGIKMIPPGLHFIYYSIQKPQEQGTGFRSGFYVCTERKEIKIYRYNASTEMLMPEEQQFETTNLYDLDRFLGPYPLDDYGRWLQLSSGLDIAAVERLVGPNRFISTDMIGLEEEKLKEFSSSYLKDEEFDLGEFRKAPKKSSSTTRTTIQEHSKEILFTEINMKYVPPNCIPQERTKYGIDKSCVLRKHFSSGHLLMQEILFSFLSFLLVYNFSGLLHWKTLVTLVCHSEEIIESELKLFLRLIDVLRFQISECNDPFMIDIFMDESNFLFSNVKFLKESFEDKPHLEAHQVALKKLVDLVQELFQWDFDE